MVLIVKLLRRPVNVENGDDELHREEESFGKRMLVNGVVKENLALRGRFDIVPSSAEVDSRGFGIDTWIQWLTPQG